ncbi:hypothetical protein BX600DRAFT_434040 [Xylariales sp. PMI_506]|nr:hypothetical protein BX600DRAFT_434040 [Xylariales sp. PMI_506]
MEFLFTLALFALITLATGSTINDGHVLGQTSTGFTVTSCLDNTTIKSTLSGFITSVKSSYQSDNTVESATTLSTSIRSSIWTPKTTVTEWSLEPFTATLSAATETVTWPGGTWTITQVDETITPLNPIPVTVTRRDTPATTTNPDSVSFDTKFWTPISTFLTTGTISYPWTTYTWTKYDTEWEDTNIFREIIATPTAALHEPADISPFPFTTEVYIPYSTYTEVRTLTELWLGSTDTFTETIDIDATVTLWSALALTPEVETVTYTIPDREATFSGVTIYPSTWTRTYTGQFAGSLGGICPQDGEKEYYRDLLLNAFDLLCKCQRSLREKLQLLYSDKMLDQQ